MTLSSITSSNQELFFFVPSLLYKADLNLQFERKLWLIFQHYECHKVSIWPGVIEHDGPYTLKSCFGPLQRDQYFYPADLLAVFFFFFSPPSVSVSLSFWGQSGLNSDSWVGDSTPKTHTKHSRP